MTRSSKVAGDVCQHMKNCMSKNGNPIIYTFIIELMFLILYIF